MLVASNFSIGIWSALFCAPLPALMGALSAEQRDETMLCLRSTCLLFSLAACPIFALLGASVGIPSWENGLFALYSAASLIRWFARATAYFQAEAWRTVASDNLYSLLLISSVIIIELLHAMNLTTAYVGLAASAILALIPFGRRFAVAQFIRLSPRSILRYGGIWRKHSGWSLLGVVTTEATVNAHAYIVTLVVGAAQFASISASALLIRPTSVFMNALGDFERPRIAAMLHGGDIRSSLAAVKMFRIVLILAWVATALAAAFILIVSPTLIFPPKYPLPYIASGASLWMAVAAIRMLRLPESILLQAGGVFRELAYASVISSVFSVTGVAILVLVAAPLWSVAGIFVGELIYAIWIWRQARRWLESQAPQLPKDYQEPCLELELQKNV